MNELLPQDFTETSLGAYEAQGIQLRVLEAIHKGFLQIVTVHNLGPLIPVAALRAVLDGWGGGKVTVKV